MHSPSAGISPSLSLMAILTLKKKQKYIPLILYRGFLFIYDNEKPDLIISRK